jgi:hypothetical protein
MQWNWGCARRCKSSLITAAFAVALASGPACATTILTPSATSAAPGGSFSIEVDDNTIDTSTIFGGLDVDVEFDPSVLSFDSATVGSVYAGYTLLSGSIGPGTEAISIGSGLGTSPGTSLFTVNFDVLSNANPGPNTISTIVSFINDPSFDTDNDGDAGLDSDNDGDGALSFFEYPVNPDPSTATVQVTPSATPVPEPSAASLFLVGLVGLSIWRFRLDALEKRRRTR